MKIGFIGMGNMAGAICQGIIKSGFIKGENVYSFDIDQTKLENMQKAYGIQLCQNENDLVKSSDVVIMAVKPQIIEKIGRAHV